VAATGRHIVAIFYRDQPKTRVQFQAEYTPGNDQKNSGGGTANR
jgi:hypothetical protein